MGQFYKGVVLILMMFGHNFVLNQPQALQQYYQEKHKVNVAQFNYLLYSLPSALAILFIIPLGTLYDQHAQKILLIGAALLIIGQISISFFSPSNNVIAFRIVVGGRVLEGVGAEVLYMIQGNLASTWMGKLAGLIFILPQIGEIANSFGTPLLVTNFNHQIALFVGLITCAISTISCFILYFYLSKKKKEEIIKNRHIAQIETKNNIKFENFSKQSSKQVVSSFPIEQISRTNIDSIIKNMEQQAITINLRENSKCAKFKQCLSFCLSFCKHLQQIFRAGKVFWLVIAVCAINQCLYFPFMDNANQLLQKRFCIPYKTAGLYLCIPFIFAILITGVHGFYILHRFSRKSLIFVCSLLPLFAHCFIYFIENEKKSTSLGTAILLMIALSFFGMGIGSYYSVSFSAVGYAVPSKIRGTAYACLCFFQTISMTLVPTISGKIITVENNLDGDSQSYKKSGLLFVLLSLIGALLSFITYKMATDQSFKYEYDEQQQKDNSGQLAQIYSNGQSIA